MLRIASALLFFVASQAIPAADYEFLSVQPVGADGISAPVLGDETYGLKVSFKAFRASGPFRVRFQIADKVGYANISGAGSWNYYYRFAMPLDGAIPYTVTLAPDDPHATGNVYQGRFTPRPPRQPVEYYDPRTLTATQTFITRFSPVGDLTDFTTVFGAPQTATNQTVLSVTPPAASNAIQTTPYGAPAFLTKLLQVPETLTQTLAFTARASSVRINVDLIRDGWSSLTLLPRDLALYTAPEPTIQSADSGIAAYVKRNLPNDYRASLMPIQAARRLFCAVIRDTAYQCPAPPSALDVLGSGRGDCGGFSRLYVACLRSVGIPARTVCGWLKGNDQWHVWSEMYLPSVGWIPQDATDGDGHCPDGSYAYEFGVVSEMNARVSVSRAATNGVLGAPIDGELQKPSQWHWYVGKVAPQLTTESHATLSEGVPLRNSTG